MTSLEFKLPGVVADSWLGNAPIVFDRTQDGDKPILVDQGEELKPFKYAQFDVSTIAEPPDLAMPYILVMREAARLLKKHGRKLGNVWLRAIAYEEKEAFGAHLDPSYLTMPITNIGTAWYGTLAYHLDGRKAHVHKFNPRKLGPDSVTWVAFVYPALTDLLPDGRTVAQYLNGLESV